MSSRGGLIEPEEWDPVEEQLAVDALQRRLFGVEAALRIGRYELHARVAHGGMGVVYRAFDPNLERDVAVKLIRPRARAALSRHLRRAPDSARVVAEQCEDMAAVFEIVKTALALLGCLCWARPCSTSVMHVRRRRGTAPD